MTTFASITRRPEFDKDFKHLLKRYRSLEDDLSVFINTQLVLLHKQKIDNRGIVLIKPIDIFNHGITIVVGYFFLYVYIKI
jgi:hypothetical protein